MDYTGVIIEESLANKAVLEGLNVVSTTVEKVTLKHKTPWLKQWTLHTVSVAPGEIKDLANKLSRSLGHNYWYADFKNNHTHYIIFPNKIFAIDRSKPEQYKVAVNYGLGLSIPDYQLDFSPSIKQWKR